MLIMVVDQTLTNLKSQKHILASRESLQSGKVSNSFFKVALDKNDLVLTACEATFLYYIVIYNIKFLIYKITCAKTKTREIIVNIVCFFIIDNMVK